MSEVKVVRVGVGVIMVRENKVLLGKRLNAHGEGTWAFPGGHLEFGETEIECAVREVKEETGLDAQEFNTGLYVNDYFEKEGKHYITLYVKATKFQGEPKIMEPHKCTEWNWFSWDDLPENLFLPIKNLQKLGFDPIKDL